MIYLETVFGRCVREVWTVKGTDGGFDSMRLVLFGIGWVTLDDEWLLIVEEVGLFAVDASDLLEGEVAEFLGGELW